MKLVCVLMVVCVALNLISADLNADWEAYKAKYNKEYNAVEDAIHRAIWEQSVIRVAAHNQLFDAGEVTFQVEINDRSDWTQQQLDAAKNHYIRQP